MKKLMFITFLFLFASCDDTTSDDTTKVQEGYYFLIRKCDPLYSICCYRYVDGTSCVKVDEVLTDAGM